MAAAFFIFIIAIIIGLLILKYFYQRAEAQYALIRTGAGGRKVIQSGGCWVLPFVHSLQKVNMSAMSVPVAMEHENAILTQDDLRADLRMSFQTSIEPEDNAINKAALALGQFSTNPEQQIAELVNPFCIDAMLAACGNRPLELLIRDHDAITAEIAAKISPKIAQYGLRLDAVSVNWIDQTAFTNLDENNIFNAVGMRQIAQVVSDHKKARAKIEAETEITLKERALERAERSIEINYNQQQMEIDAANKLEILKKESANTTQQRGIALENEVQLNRLKTENDLKQAELKELENLRKQELASQLVIEQNKIANATAVNVEKAKESEVLEQLELSRLKIIKAQEAVQTSKEIARAERSIELARMKLAEDKLVSEESTKTAVETLLANAKADAEVANLSSAAKLTDSLNQAKADQARILAENQMSSEAIEYQVHLKKLDRMPEILNNMMKPVEKIDSIKIHQFNTPNSGSNNSGGNDSAVGNAMDQILGMAVSLPMMKKLGDEIGMDFDINSAGRTADYVTRVDKANQASKPDTASKADDTAPVKTIKK